MMTELAPEDNSRSSVPASPTKAPSPDLPYGPDCILAAVTMAETVGCRLEIWAKRKLNDLEIARAYLAFMDGKDMRTLKNANCRMLADT